DQGKLFGLGRRRTDEEGRHHGRASALPRLHQPVPVPAAPLGQPALSGRKRNKKGPEEIQGLSYSTINAFSSLRSNTRSTAGRSWPRFRIWPDAAMTAYCPWRARRCGRFSTRYIGISLERR